MPTKSTVKITRSASCIHRGKPPESLMAITGFIMIKLAQYIQDQSDEAFESLEQPGVVEMKGRHLAVLHVLISEGPSTQQFLCSGMWIDRGTMVGVIDVLEKNGFVQRKANPDDQRSYVISVTAQGRKFHRQNAGFFESLESKIFPGLTDSERGELRTLLRKIMHHTCQD
jgi:DNA-binding MarR family transcriptional regulator